MPDTSTAFLNLDLDLECDSDLRSLVVALESEMCALHLYEDRATLELSYQPATVADAIDGVVSAVERLSADDRAAWEKCTKRSCNVGIQAGMEPYEASFVVPPSSIAGLGRIGAELVFTVYRPDQQRGERPDARDAVRAPLV